MGREEGRDKAKNKDETMGRKEGRDKENKIGEKLGSKEHGLYREEKDQAMITTNTINVELTYIYEHSSQ